MDIKVLGCSGAEFPGHYPTGFLVDGRILLDAGTLNSALNAKDQAKVKNIFITHAHLDHTREIPFLADNLFIGGYKQKVNIFSISPVIRDIKNNILNRKVWPDMTVLPNVRHPLIGLNVIRPYRPLEIEGYSVTAYRVNHSVPAVGYLVENRKGRRFFYTGDTGPTGPTWEKLGGKKIDCLIIESSFPNRLEEMAVMTGHLTPALLKKELLKMKFIPERIYVTHLKPQFHKAIGRELQKLKLKNLILLKEGDSIRV
jgi:ribonuclease BN (tRNA processing enzyme)